MRNDHATDLLDLLCAYYAKRLPEATREAWVSELRSLDFALASIAVRSLVVGSKFWPSVAELYEQYDIAREQAWRAQREEERRAAEEEIDGIERPPLREIPAVQEYVARHEVVVGVPEEGKGDCSDCGQHRPALYRIGKFRVCTECARKRLRARALDITDDAAASG